MIRINGIILIIPIILIRYIYLKFISKPAFDRAGYFPPAKGIEKLAVWVYQLATIFLIIFPVFYQINFNDWVNYIGIGIYILSIILYMKSTYDFTKTSGNGISNEGVFKISRNPMYIAFFLYFIGISLLINSWWYFLIVVILQISVHYIILSEERWCLKEFGDEYVKYMRKVRSYF